MEHILPKRDPQFEVEHQNAQGIADDDKQLVVQRRLQVYVLPDEFCCFETSSAHNLVVKGSQLFLDLLKLLFRELVDNDAAKERKPVANQAEDVFVLLPLLTVEHFLAHISHTDAPEQIVKKVVAYTSGFGDDLQQVIEGGNRRGQVTLYEDGLECNLETRG